ncbi:MAG: hypothetical protein AAGU05_00635 [Anaerolineaceae bacterium]
MDKKSAWVRVLWIGLVVLIALGTRLDAVNKLPIDYDEDDYLGAGQRYLRAFREGDWQFVSDYGFNYEHPPLPKLINALVMLPLPDAPLIEENRPAPTRPNRFRSRILRLCAGQAPSSARWKRLFWPWLTHWRGCFWRSTTGRLNTPPKSCWSRCRRSPVCWR